MAPQPNATRHTLYSILQAESEKQARIWPLKTAECNFCLGGNISPLPKGSPEQGIHNRGDLPGNKKGNEYYALRHAYHPMSNICTITYIYIQLRKISLLCNIEKPRVIKPLQCLPNLRTQSLLNYTALVHIHKLP